MKLSQLARHLEVTPITPTSKKKETTQEAKGNTKKGKTNWIVGVYTKNLTDPNRHETLTQEKHKVSSLIN